MLLLLLLLLLLDSDSLCVQTVLERQVKVARREGELGESKSRKGESVAADGQERSLR